MIFTKDDIDIIEERLQHRSIKDSELEQISSLEETDKVPILKDNKNKILPVSILKNYVKEVTEDTIRDSKGSVKRITQNEYNALKYKNPDILYIIV